MFLRCLLLGGPQQGGHRETLEVFAKLCFPFTICIIVLTSGAVTVDWSLSSSFSLLEGPQI